MLNKYKILDADSHVTEPFEMWEEYLEPEFKSRAPYKEQNIEYSDSSHQMLLPWVQRAQTLDLDDLVAAALDFVRANSYAYEVALEKFY
ncbi:MAG: hypothetical protein GDA48_14590 [Hormoscilla sp. GM102CHS1]|nr:hypothetical protein [Hormoscilla sp. GM102CHS1]